MSRPLDLRYHHFYRFKYDPRTHGDLEHLDTRFTSLLGALTVLGKHPDTGATFVCPANTDVHAAMQKRSYRIRWQADKEELVFSPEMKSVWRTALHWNGTRFIISFVSLGCDAIGWHANVIIYDKNTRELEVFDPLGCEVSRHFKATALYENLFAVMRHERLVLGRSKLIVPSDYCHVDDLEGPILQSAELDERDSRGLTGSCAVWRLWWIDVRLANPDCDRQKLVQRAMSFITQKKKLSLTVFIRKYQKHILHIINLKWPQRCRTNTINNERRRDIMLFKELHQSS